MPESKAAAPRRAKKAIELSPASVAPCEGPAAPVGPIGAISSAPPADAPSTYQEALKLLAERVDFERARAGALNPGMFKLDRMRALLEALGNPQASLRCVHVAGTKGKGSTCEMTASCLEACGYTVGVYTSPHLVDIRERVRINKRMIGYADFARLLFKAAEGAAKIAPAHGAATYFELVTALGLCHFAEQAVDVAVIECGLGGRLDSTNVIVPDVCAITSISLDHTQLLGDSIEKIAREKAGIFKPGVPALTVMQAPSVLEVLKEVAAEVAAPLQVVGQDIDFSVRFENSGSAGPHARVCLTGATAAFEHLRVPLKGEHQAHNCGLALAILDKLAERGFSTPESKVTLGLDRTELSGRMEMASRTPRIMLDGAHNPDSVRCLMKAIGAHVPYDSMVLVFGCCADKDVPGMLGQIALGADKVIFTKSSANPRSADPRELHRKFTELTGKMSQVAKTLPEALDLAGRAVGRDDLICVTGSFYLVGEAKRYLASRPDVRRG
ncbi:MAG: bifunctional folylpolyglutamate synthase/dihydrofolate synthase [Phycisphaerales bacterium]|nr:bifunctional folylpolyglutamate synthase/dihydrofolate synthase [Phycisphaerales bacterium]